MIETALTVEALLSTAAERALLLCPRIFQGICRERILRFGREIIHIHCAAD